MSINSLTTDEIFHSKDFNQAVQDLVDTGTPVEAARAKNEKTVLENSTSKARNILFKYIPTESVTLYIAGISASPALLKTLSWLTPTVMYWFFGFFTPILVLLIYFGKLKASNLTIPIYSLRKWPWWKMVAATVAFFVWGLAVPGNPYVHGENASALAGFVAIFSSTILSLLEPLFD